ncbi:hypothetical protein [Cytobacillus sp. IB215665]|uniref:hypothetical protein n=1 Tax=Cytobacillus sp. IB215665 TaxID=3097357 RepID=UPI002A1122A5|nr:hypothetical protein [Cytobacillus sp. IB215665]MDX8367725.1 hypothetical protein [Cytobacillus sp. IB215665]
MKEYIIEIENLVKELDEQKKKKLKIDVLMRMLNMLKDEPNHKLLSDFDELKKLLTEVIQHYNKTKIKVYRQYFHNIQEAVEKEFGYVEKGALIGRYVGIWIAMGSGIGLIMGMIIGSGIDNIGVGVALGPGFGTAIGIVIGSGIIGTSKEKEADSKGLTY